VHRATLLAGEREIAVAHVSRISAREVPVPEDVLGDPPPDEPEGKPDDRALRPGDDKPRFHSHAVELRSVSGSYGTPGPAVAWLRIVVPLLAAEPMSPAVRAAVTADLVGFGNVLPIGRYAHPNADVTLGLHREPDGDWIRVDCHTAIGPHGVGLNHAVMADRRGPVGRASQTLVLAAL
jgi:hypothetical protein